MPDDGDTHVRAVCSACGHVHYANPLPVVGTIACWEGKVLLCRRAIEPRYGKWTLPAGFMELGETLADGAARETREEAGAQFTMGELHSVVSLPQVGQVHFFYRAQLQSPQLSPGPESLEAALFDEAAIPWNCLAFRTVQRALTAFFADRRQGRFTMHDSAIME